MPRVGKGVSGGSRDAESDFDIRWPRRVPQMLHRWHTPVFGGCNLMLNAVYRSGLRLHYAPKAAYLCLELLALLEVRVVLSRTEW